MRALLAGIVAGFVVLAGVTGAWVPFMAALGIVLVAILPILMSTPRRPGA